MWQKAYAFNKDELLNILLTGETKRMLFLSLSLFKIPEGLRKLRNIVCFLWNN